MFATLLLTPRSKHSVVALGELHDAQRSVLTKPSSTQKRVKSATTRDVALDWACFQRDVAALASTLKCVEPPAAGAIPKISPTRWLLFTENPYAFAVALTALAQSGAVAVLPPNGQRETLQELAPGCIGLLSDQPQLAPSLHTLDPLAPSQADSAANFTVRALDPDAPFLELCTSGSTGKRKRVVKCVRHIDSELATLEKVFGAQLPPDTQIFAMASHQHLYGLLFRTLWPLTTGRPFRLESFLYPEEIVPRMAKTKACALISTPTHLNRLKDVLGLETLRTNCRAIFSSGGPLGPDTAAALVRILGKAPIEIFGSTETGGVAWRTQSGSAQDTLWSTLPGVEVQCAEGTGLLRVRSAFVSPEIIHNSRLDHSSRATATNLDTETSMEFEMGDCVEIFSDGRFASLGRADRIVKIGEKRLSLPEMEARLLENPLLQAVALVPIERSGTLRVGAAAVLSEAGRALLARSGRRVLAQELALGLQHRFDRIVLPRAWRYLDQLPEDAQGKVTQNLLRALFKKENNATSGDDTLSRRIPSPTEGESIFARESKQPIVLRTEHDNSVCKQRCRVPGNLAYFDGHFPMHPIVPGVVQLDWVMTAAHDLWDNVPAPLRIEVLKFKKLLLPGQEFDLTLKRTKDKLSFELRHPTKIDEIFSSGRFVFASSTDGKANALEAPTMESTQNESKPAPQTLSTQRETS